MDDWVMIRIKDKSFEEFKTLEEAIARAEVLKSRGITDILLYRLYADLR